MVRESDPNLQHISLWAKNGIAWQAIIICFKPKFKNQGSNYNTRMEFFLLVSASNGHSTETVVLGLTLPLSGWLADVYLGHYRVIRWSIYASCGLAQCWLQQTQLHERTHLWCWIWKCDPIHYHWVWYLLAFHSSQIKNLGHRNHQL